MTVQVVGSGLGRTGTMSLKLALERLLGGPCYHMVEVGAEGHVDTWRRAAEGDPPDWTEFLDGWVAIVDWPGASFWAELASAFPRAKILHSERSDTDTWLRSAHATILDTDSHRTERSAFDDMWNAVSSRTFDGPWTNLAVTARGYEQHNAHVRGEAPADRLVLYRPGDGWAPLCEALGLPVPDEPFPHVNTTDQFVENRRKRAESADDS